jgi:dimethylaniline monooxygenase (N-oxide forming)
MDLSNEISKVAERVTLSHHLKDPPKTQFSENLDQKPDVAKLTEKGVEFTDGTHETYSIIFYCTGYKYTFPFLSIDCGVECDDNYVRPLYKHCLSINRPSLGFIGLPFYVCASQMFDLQSRFFLTFLTGQKRLPSKDEMVKDCENEMNQRWQKGLRKHQAHVMGEDQGKYYSELAGAAGLSPLKPVMTKLHNFSSMRFVDDLINFRKDIFRVVDDEIFVKVC